MNGFRGSRVRRWVAWVTGFVLVAASVLGWAACHLLERTYSKEQLPHAEVAPHSALEVGPPELQLEDHTCGFHSLSILYRAHGLDPEAEQLRARLGVDVPANPKDASTTGTLHPDLLRVLRQDHFGSTFLDPEGDDTLASLERHTDAGRTFLILIQRAETGGLHWVAASRGSSSGELRIFDSLVVEPYEVNVRDYLRERVLSLLTLEPDEHASFDAKGKIYADGIAEMVRVKRRLDARAAALQR